MAIFRTGGNNPGNRVITGQTFAPGNQVIVDAKPPPTGEGGIAVWLAAPIHRINILTTNTMVEPLVIFGYIVRKKTILES